MKEKTAYCLIVFILCGTLAGCGGSPKPDGMPKLSSCTVTILGDGQPVQGAVVGFHHSDPNFRWSPGGTTDAAGKAEMVTYGQYFGVVDGDYIVTVTKTERETFDPEKPPKEVKIFTAVDPKFADPTTSTLKIKVAGKTTETFDVGKSVKEVLRVEAPM